MVGNFALDSGIVNIFPIVPGQRKSVRLLSLVHIMYPNQQIPFFSEDSDVFEGLLLLSKGFEGF